jgi:site-specific DNA-methyltransferase (cytosine-N4-specific)
VDDVTLLQGDCLDILPTLGAGSVDAIVTSPPYFHQRDYGHPSQIGLEETVAGYVASLVRVFTLASLTLKPTGTFWINLGDSFNGYFGNQRGTSLEETVQATRPKFPQGMGLRCKILKNKDLIGIPWRVAFALQESGLYLRSDNIWFKTEPKPESRVKDRPHRAHEYVFLFSKGEDYYFDRNAIRPTKPGRNSVWPISPRRASNSHPADYPLDLVRPCVLMGCPEGGTVLDPFAGSGTTLVVCRKSGRKAIGIELIEVNIEEARRRLIHAETPLFQGFGVDILGE